MAPRMELGEHSHLGSHADDTEGEVSMSEHVLHSSSTGYNQPLDVAVFRTFKSSVSWQATSAVAKEVRDNPAD